MKTNIFVLYFFLQTIVELISSRYILFKLKNENSIERHYGFRTNVDGAFRSKKQTSSHQRSINSLGKGIFHK